MTMGERIHILRKQHHLTLEDVGNAVGVGRSTVRKWETGMIANMGCDKIQTLATVLHTTPSYLTGWDENREEQSDEVALIERIQANWGKDTAVLIENYMTLNKKNRSKLSTYCKDLLKVEKFEAMESMFKD